MITFLLTIAVFGFLGATVLFPLVGNLVSSCRRSSKNIDSCESSSHCGEVRNVAVLIPAHNEGAVLGATIDSIQSAIDFARAIYPQTSVRVFVGADGCSDNTASLARGRGATVVEANPSLGKWRMLRNLLSYVNGADWVIFADSGILWSENFVARLLEIAVLDPHTVGVAPSYQNPAGGKIESTLWEIERALKALEGAAGGPVTIHGATVAYRTKDLIKALEALGDEAWLNDDVVIPLMLRSQNPHSRIRYLADLAVCDQPEAGVPTKGSVGQELVRRRRMVVGNAQWMRSLLRGVWHSNRVAGVLALRRVFRLLWAYWVVLGAAGGALLFASFVGVHPFVVIGTGLILASIGCFFVAPLQRMVDAAYASLLAPYYLLRYQNIRPVVWR